jgi:hypothetical protein
MIMTNLLFIRNEYNFIKIITREKRNLISTGNNNNIKPAIPSNSQNVDLNDYNNYNNDNKNIVILSTVY